MTNNPEQSSEYTQSVLDFAKKFDGTPSRLSDAEKRAAAEALYDKTTDLYTRYMEYTSPVINMLVLVKNLGKRGLVHFAIASPGNMTTVSVTEQRPGGESSDNRGIQYFINYNQKEVLRSEATIYETTDRTLSAELALVANKHLDREHRFDNQPVDSLEINALVQLLDGAAPKALPPASKIYFE